MPFWAQWGQHTVKTPNTNHLLYACKHSWEHEALGSKVDNTEEQSVKDQQRGLISIKQHITERVGLICWNKSKHTLSTYTYVCKQKEKRSLSGPRGHYRCKICFFRWVQGTPSLWLSQTSACPSLYSPCQGGPELKHITWERTSLYQTFRTMKTNSQT